MNKVVLSFLVALLLWTSGCVQARTFKPHEPFDAAKAQSLPLTPMSIESGGQFHRFEVEVADTNETRETGLMHRAALGADRGMLFTYDRPARMMFWMRNTFIPLDMLFMKSDGRIAYIVENVQPHDERPVGPSFAVVAQLELPAGTVSRLKIKTGDILHHASFGNAR